MPTLRRIPIGQRDPKPGNTGTIVHAFGEVHAFGPDAKWLGRYPNLVVAQRRLDLFFGRKAVAAEQGRKPEGQP